MIAFLEGKLEIKHKDFAVLNVNGVGYRVEVSSTTFEQLPELNKEVRLRIHHHITDNDQRLFGFFTEREQKLFENLITVKGVGPKLGLTIMSGLKAPLLIEAIIQQDQAGLSRIPGIGKKTAQRIILELKDKILDTVGSEESTGSKTMSSNREEAISALLALGFKKREAEKTVMGILEQGEVDTVSEIIKKSLTHLNK
jgi:holliday junction DNA helicase RuvA